MSETGTGNDIKKWQLYPHTFNYLLLLSPKQCREAIKENLDAMKIFDGTIDQRLVNGRCTVLVDGELQTVYYKQMGIMLTVEFSNALSDATILYEKRLHAKGMTY